MAGITKEESNIPLMARGSRSLGIPRRKRRIEFADATAVLASVIFFALAYITVAPLTRIPWQLGLTRQFQVIGLLLSAMNQCFLSLAPTVFVLIETSFGKSYLQNYDAILRKSFTKADTGIMWRGVLASIAVIPIALSIAYKEFDHGSSSHIIKNNGSHVYGLLPIAGLEDRWIGLTYFANTTMSFTAAIFDDPPLPEFPVPYGYNILTLSNTSGAVLDMPAPQYVREIQNELQDGESYDLEAEVYATVTTYNETVETHRDDDEFWNYYLSQMQDRPDRYISQPNDSAKDAYLESKLSALDLYNNQSISALVNSILVRNTSWMFFEFVQSALAEGNVSTYSNAFRQNAMLFNTRRESCIGSWRITYNSMQLLAGSCDQPPLSEDHQQLLTSAQSALSQWYLAPLGEYLGRFTVTPDSIWKTPAYCTVLAAMYWSRLTHSTVSDMWGVDGPTYGATSNLSAMASDAYYLSKDIVTSNRVTMNPNGWLYVVLATFPVLTFLLFVCTVLLHKVPLDSGFGIVALLAGVQTSTLSLLSGASRSGKLMKPVQVSIDSGQASLNNAGGVKEMTYVLHDS